MSVADRAAALDDNLTAEALRAKLIEVEPLAAADPSAIRLVRAPGRVNLIGEHTDYNLGFVLPAAINLEVRIAFVPTDDRRVEIVSGATGERQGFDLRRIGRRRSQWIDYLAGTAWALAEAGIATRGIRGVIVSSLPTGSGLSSSAALELAAAWALAEEPGGGVAPIRLAQVCQHAENAHVGVNCGLMDQFASACGVDGAAVLLDCRSLDHRAVALPLETHTLVVLHSGSPRSLSTSQYNVRRAQCESGVAALADLDPGLESLRDVTEEMLPLIRDEADEVVFRRCRHVVTENVRVQETLAAFAAGDLAAVGRLFAASHASLRDDFEVSSPELDALVAIAIAVPGVVAARMTGAGFGGCTINLVERGAVAALRDAILAQYPARTGLQPRVFAVDPVGGAGPVAVE
jgi:galactokinase